MRKFILVTALLLSSLPAFSHKDRIEKIQTLAITFKTGEVVTFFISGAAVSEIRIHIGTSDYAVPAGECTKLRDVRFETVSLLWDGSYASTAQAKYFYLRFDMGADSARTFGELPSLEVMFRDGKFLDAIITRKTSETTWQRSTL